MGRTGLAVGLFLTAGLGLAWFVPTWVDFFVALYIGSLIYVNIVLIKCIIELSHKHWHIGWK